MAMVDCASKNIKLYLNDEGEEFLIEFCVPKGKFAIVLGHF